MKRSVLLFAFLLSVILILHVVIAADSDSGVSLTGTDEDSKIDKAYACLNGKINESCSPSLEDNIFVLLATGKCKNEVIDTSKNNSECWPSSGCKLKSTAQSILALKNSGFSSEKAENWLLSQNKTPTNLEWYIEIESSEPTICKVKYSGSEYAISVSEDKKISSNAGTCLSLSEGAWWLKISPLCFTMEFEISCDKDFLTTLIYKKGTSSTVYVSEETNVASANAVTNEKINSFCFTEGGECNYEGSLWSALALSATGHEVSSYLPYLISEAGSNKKYIPESFLYIITASSDFRNTLLLNQKNNYWEESGDKFYDTAVALYSLQYEDPVEKSNSKSWLLDPKVQGSDGCLGGSIKNTAFILASVWPRTIYSPNVFEDDCGDMEFYCMSSASCRDAGGSELDYDCSSPNVCCSQEEVLDSCSEQGGDICFSDEDCIGGILNDASDVSYGEQCCVGGTCEESGGSVEVANCVSNDGECRMIQCEDNEEESYSYTCDNNDICCVKTSSPSYWWIWLLIILIILVILAIIFKDRLKVYWNKFKNKNSKSSGPPSGPFGAQSIPMVSPNPMIQRPVRRRILPPQRRYPVRRALPKKPSEVDEVLKKLKEIGK